MRAASDLADWWDKQHSVSQRALDDFVDEYPGLFGIMVATAAATAMEVGKGTATLAMEVLATTAGDAETTEQMFEAYKNVPATQAVTPKAIVFDPIHIKAGEPVPGGTYTVKSGDSLSKISQRAYGDMMKFGVIYMANRKTIGPNPDLIHPGQALAIPVL